LTRVCIGSEDKIRLKILWDKLKDRGIVFDETTKLEITKLFEKINLIEKKSDSGDAQYVKSTI
jgi:DNA phosphorothioation-dependent restriction protein DptG